LQAHKYLSSSDVSLYKNYADQITLRTSENNFLIIDDTDSNSRNIVVGNQILPSELEILYGAGKCCLRKGLKGRRKIAIEAVVGDAGKKTVQRLRGVVVEADGFVC